VACINTETAVAQVGVDFGIVKEVFLDKPLKSVDCKKKNELNINKQEKGRIYQAWLDEEAKSVCKKV
jgi:hypothetical protein